MPAVRTAFAVPFTCETSVQFHDAKEAVVFQVPAQPGAGQRLLDPAQVEVAVICPHLLSIQYSSKPWPDLSPTRRAGYFLGRDVVHLHGVRLDHPTRPRQ